MFRLLILCTLILTGSAQAIELSSYKKKGCEGVFVSLAEQYLNNNADFYWNHISYSSLTFIPNYDDKGKYLGAKIDEEFELCAVEEFGQGSLSIPREVT